MKLQAADADEKAAIQSQIDELERRWSSLNNLAGQRSTSLEDVASLSRDFQAMCQPLDEWLDTTKKRLRHMDTNSTDPATLEAQIQEHKVRIYS